VTYYVNLRAGPWGAVCSPYLLGGDGLASPPAMTAPPWGLLPGLVRGKDVLLAAHGFNVSYASGLASLAQLERALGLDVSASDQFLGVLWPGDWAIPAVNYPAEDSIASHAGRLLGGFCNQWLGQARSLNFLSHSLGARVILEAIAACSQRVRTACITAGAVNAGCLGEEYARAAADCDRILTLSSRSDLVLQFAFPPGDFLADILYPDHPQFEEALGREGPERPVAANVGPSQIADAAGYDHGDYFPPGSLQPPTVPPAKWTNSAGFMGRVYRGQAPNWP
jgi:hypothetical protein